MLRKKNIKAAHKYVSLQKRLKCQANKKTSNCAKFIRFLREFVFLFQDIAFGTKARAYICVTKPHMVLRLLPLHLFKDQFHKVGSSLMDQNIRHILSPSIQPTFIIPGKLKKKD